MAAQTRRAPEKAVAVSAGKRRVDRGAASDGPNIALTSACTRSRRSAVHIVERVPLGGPVMRLLDIRSEKERLKCSRRWRTRSPCALVPRLRAAAGGLPLRGPRTETQMRLRMLA